MRDEPLGRRAFLAGALATAAAAACAGDDDDPAPSTTAGATPTTASAAAAIPTAAVMMGWITEVCAQGVRRPGYDADAWTEAWCADRLREIGLTDVRREPITVRRWEPTEWRLEVMTEGGPTEELECFPVPFAAPTEAVELELADMDAGAEIAGRAALRDVALLRLPPDAVAGFGSVPADPDERARRVHDPEGTFAGAQHVVPFGTDFQAVVEPALAAGAAAAVLVCADHPGDTCRYFVPYDAHERPIPAVWVRGSDGARLHDLLAAGPVRVRLAVASTSEEVESSNVVGVLPGAGDEDVIIASHHDGPWASAVEDGSGIALVLAQATYWASVPQADRPHRLVFLLQGGHMSGGAGLAAYIEAHRPELARTVVEIHLEHAAREVVERDGELVPTGQPTPRWWFTSRIPPLEDIVLDAIAAEGLDRSMLVAPDALGPAPTTDGALYHLEGVPIVHHLAAPLYLFDEADTVDKVDEASLEPLTRATIRIVEATAGLTAAGLREQVVA